MINDGIYTWLLSSLFWIGVLLLPIALALIFAPVWTMQCSNKLNRWISTKQLFENLNRPRYQERILYRHHRTFGAMIVLLSLFSVYMLFFYSGPTETLGYFTRLVKTQFGIWLVTNCYYILLFLNVLAFFIGILVFFRPSLLKSIEHWSNRWVETENTLEGLDRVHEIPANILPGKPRIFGLIVLIGSVYILYSSGKLLF
jgi:hypothetical protein